MEAEVDAEMAGLEAAEATFVTSDQTVKSPEDVAKEAAEEAEWFKQMEAEVDAEMALLDSSEARGAPSDPSKSPQGEPIFYDTWGDFFKYWLDQRITDVSLTDVILEKLLPEDPRALELTQLNQRMNANPSAFPDRNLVVLGLIDQRRSEAEARARGKAVHAMPVEEIIGRCREMIQEHERAEMTIREMVRKVQERREKEERGRREKEVK